MSWTIAQVGDLEDSKGGSRASTRMRVESRPLSSRDGNMVSGRREKFYLKWKSQQTLIVLKRETKMP